MELVELQTLIKDIKHQDSATERMCGLAIKYVLNNSKPRKLGSVNYNI